LDEAQRNTSVLVRVIAVTDSVSHSYPGGKTVAIYDRGAESAYMARCPAVSDEPLLFSTILWKSLWETFC